VANGTGRRPRSRGAGPVAAGLGKRFPNQRSGREGPPAPRAAGSRPRLRGALWHTDCLILQRGWSLTITGQAVVATLVAYPTCRRMRDGGVGTGHFVPVRSPISRGHPGVGHAGRTAARVAPEGREVAGLVTVATHGCRGAPSVSVGVATTETIRAVARLRSRRRSCSPGVAVGVPFGTGCVRSRASSAVTGVVHPARSSWNPRPTACVARTSSSSFPPSHRPSRRRSDAPWDDSAASRGGKERPPGRRSPGPPEPRARSTIYRPYLVGLT